MSEVKIQTALVSVYHKEGLEPVVSKLHELGVKLISTGGTESFIRSLNLPVASVESITGFPEILGGRVKTLHPKIFGGILERRENEEDKKVIQELNIPEIDLVIADLYPFEETVASSATEDEIIEKIDIGGVSLIRAAAKNFRDVLVCASHGQYKNLLELLDSKNGVTDLQERMFSALIAFETTSHYEIQIFHYFNRRFNIPAFKQSIQQYTPLRYGENPHQAGVYYGDLGEIFDQLSGKYLSYNNLVDVDSAMELIEEFAEPTFAIIKHTNACGCASNQDLTQAWKMALAGDPVSAFGGVIICNRKITSAAATLINELFFEVLIAPNFYEEALIILKSKKNRIILQQKSKSAATKSFKRLLNGVIEQEKDLRTESENDLQVATNNAPTPEQISDLLFANKLEKHLKSNAIVLVKNKQLIGMGCGMTSRVDALKHAIQKAREHQFEIQGAVMASEAFFPFPDCVQIAHSEGISAVIQPGGSIRDKESIDYCNEVGLPMVITGVRHFKH